MFCRQKSEMKNGRKYNSFKAAFAEISAGIKNRNWEEVLTKSFAEDHDTFFDILTGEIRDNPFSS